MDEILKGNFKVKKPVSSDTANETPATSLKDELKKRALASIGGSMVFVERQKLNWDGDDR